MDNLFAYGTLLCEDIFIQVAGCRCRRSHAVLEGYQRYRIRGEEYPGLTPAAGSRVQGLVYLDLPLSAWDRLDIFEGKMYERIPVRIELAGKDIRSAYTYVVRPESTFRLEADEWQLDDFLKKGKSCFRKMYLGFDALDEGS